MLVGNKEFYGYEIHKTLENQGINIEISRLYRILNEMLKDNLFSSRWEKSTSGPKKRVYKLDRNGRKIREKILVDAIGVVHKFYGEYLVSLPSEINVFDMITDYFKDQINDTSKIGILTQRQSKIVEIIIKKIHKKTSLAKFFIIKPTSFKLNIKLKNLMFVEGDFSSIPLKDNYLNLLIVMGIPDKSLFNESLKEWSRIVNSKGELVVIAPTVLIEDYKDPKSIGEFFEEFEHYESQTMDKIGMDEMKRDLKKLFRNVEKTEIVHVTIFKASELIT